MKARLKGGTSVVDVGLLDEALVKAEIDKLRDEARWMRRLSEYLVNTETSSANDLIERAFDLEALANRFSELLLQ